MYSKEEYIAALHWFGWTLRRAEIIVEQREKEGSLHGINHLVREHKRHL